MRKNLGLKEKIMVNYFKRKIRRGDDKMKNGKKYSKLKGFKKFLEGSGGTVVAFGVLYLITKDTHIAEAEILEFRGMLVALIGGLAGILNVIRNGIKFISKRKKGDE